jgi:hypothetical protein
MQSIHELPGKEEVGISLACGYAVILSMNW